MRHLERSKNPFPDHTILAKHRMKMLRLTAGYDMNRAAHLLQLTRKTLEDVETLRPYGCHISLDLMVQYCAAYGCDMTEFTRPLSLEEQEYVNAYRNDFRVANAIA